LAITIKFRIISGFSLILILFFIISIANTRSLNNIRHGMNEVTEHNMPLVIKGGQLMNVILEADKIVTSFASAPSDKDLDVLQQEFSQNQPIANKILGFLGQYTSQADGSEKIISGIKLSLNEFFSKSLSLADIQKKYLTNKTAVNIAAAKLDDASSTLLKNIAARLNDVQGKLTVVRAFYTLKDLTAKNSSFALQLRYQQELDSAMALKQSFPVDAKLITEALKSIQDSNIIDPIEFEDLSDNIERFTSQMRDKNGYLSSIINLLEEVEERKELLTAINLLSEQMNVVLKDFVNNSETVANQAKNNAYEIINKTRTLLMGGTIVACIFALAVGLWLIESIQKPLSRVVKILKLVSKGDLTTTLDQSSKDEFGQLAKEVNTLMKELNIIIRGIYDSSHELTSVAQQNLDVSALTKAAVNEQKSQTDQVATAMHEMSATTNEVAGYTEKNLLEVNHIRDSTHEGKKVVEDTLGKIQRLTSRIKEGEVAVNQLVSNVKNISSILDVIRSIAEQTNLLALNAAIEAARAGEQGRGFAVVADEVRSLATRTQQSTLQIQGMIESLQTGTRQVSDIMSKSVIDGSETMHNAQESQVTLNALAKMADALFDQTTFIATASEQQGAVANEITKNITKIADISEKTDDLATLTSGKSHELSLLATKLVSLVKIFKIK